MERETCVTEANDEILAFLNPSPAHGVPDSYAVTVTLRYTGTGRPLGQDPTLSARVAVLTALDMCFDGADVDRRSVVRTFTIAPEGEERGEADIAGDLTKELRRAVLVAEVANNFPLAGRAFVRIDHDPLKLWQEPELTIGPFDFAAPATDEAGKPVETVTTRSTVSLDRRQLLVFTNPGPGVDTVYAAVDYVLDGTGPRRVCICGDDSLSVWILMGLTSEVNAGDGG